MNVRQQTYKTMCDVKTYCLTQEQVLFLLPIVSLISFKSILFAFELRIYPFDYEMEISFSYIEITQRNGIFIIYFFFYNKSQFTSFPRIHGKQQLAKCFFDLDF